jgi:hypothetical protein
VSPKQPSIPLADFGAFVRRSLAVRRIQLALAALLVGLGATVLLAALSVRATTTSVLPRSASGIVVLDVSASISSDTYARIAGTLDRLVRSGGEYGLVLFSDTAYQALPPHTPSRELRPFSRFFTVAKRSEPGALPQLPRSPWADAFSAGTRISTGLTLALDVIREERVARPAVLLVSDLDNDTGDLERVTQVALAYRRAGIPLHVIGLNAAPEDVAFIRQIVPRDGTLSAAPPPGERAASTSAELDLRLVLAAVLAAVVFAAFVAATERLRWRHAP